MDFEGNEYRDRVRGVRQDLVGHGLMTPSGNLETGHRVIVSYSNPHSQWYANLYHPDSSAGHAHALWLGDDDAEVPGRFLEGLHHLETMNYLRSTLPSS